MKLTLATQNPHKTQEMAAMLEPLKIEVLKAPPDCRWNETGDTFEANATIKAHAVAELDSPSEGSWILADDSGLIVPALAGAPGVHSSRYAGSNSDDASNNKKLIDQLSRIKLDEAPAFFCCVLVLLKNNDILETFRGECHGLVKITPKGEHGFGYDPLFFLPDMNCHMAELTASQKNKISHRALAMAKLFKFFQEN
jgi:XTP/dITP diphosphohydrolase